MKKILVGILVAFAFMSCQDKNAYTITGTVKDAGENLTAMLYSDMRGAQAADSAEVKNGTFVFEGVAGESPKMMFLMVQDAEGSPALGRPAFVIIEPGKITITASKEENSIVGTPLNDKNNEFAKMMDAAAKEVQLEKLQEFVSTNADNILGAFYFTMIFPTYDAEEMDAIVAKVPEAVKSEEWFVATVEHIKEMKAASRIGQKYIDVEGLTLDGKKAKLSDYVGKDKVVFLDFWASWCGPCIDELPNVVKTYAQYKDKGFEIVGVSLDEEKSAWKAATDKHGITWPQFSNLQGWEEPAARAYNVRSIPTTLLIDKDGTIIAENLRGDKLAKKLDEVLK